MKREIKLRAWDKENEVMHFSNEHEDQIVWEITPEIQFLELRTVDSFPGGQYHEQKEEWVKPDQTLMQYTGFKINGKEAYEGDIVENDTEWWQIVFDADEGSWQCNPILGGNTYIALSELAYSKET